MFIYIYTYIYMYIYLYIYIYISLYMYVCVSERVPRSSSRIASARRCSRRHIQHTSHKANPHNLHVKVIPATFTRGRLATCWRSVPHAPKAHASGLKP